MPFKKAPPSLSEQCVVAGCPERHAPGKPVHGLDLPMGLNIKSDVGAHGCGCSAHYKLALAQRHKSNGLT